VVLPFLEAPTGHHRRPRSRVPLSIKIGEEEPKKITTTSSHPISFLEKN
jgi:hypothetical protein